MYNGMPCPLCALVGRVTICNGRHACRTQARPRSAPPTREHIPPLGQDPKICSFQPWVMRGAKPRWPKRGIFRTYERRRLGFVAVRPQPFRDYRFRPHLAHRQILDPVPPPIRHDAPQRPVPFDPEDELRPAPAHRAPKMARAARGWDFPPPLPGRIPHWIEFQGVVSSANFLINPPGLL